LIIKNTNLIAEGSDSLLGHRYTHIRAQLRVPSTPPGKFRRIVDSDEPHTEVHQRCD